MVTLEMSAVETTNVDPQRRDLMKAKDALLLLVVSLLSVWMPATAGDAKAQEPPKVQIPQPGVPQIMTMEGNFVRAAYNNEGYVIFRSDAGTCSRCQGPGAAEGANPAARRAPNHDDGGQLRPGGVQQRRLRHPRISARQKADRGGAAG